MVARMDYINEQLRARGLPAIKYGLGINTGEGVVGQMGSSFRKQYDVIGDVMNTAARLCGAAGGGEIIISESTWELIGDRLILVDLPVYCYAAVSQAEARRWGQTVSFYLGRRGALKRALLLVDARHGLKDGDRLALDLLAHHAVSVMAVLTKADKVEAAECAAQIAAVGAALVRHPSAFPLVVPTSAETGYGIPALRALLAALAS